MERYIVVNETFFESSSSFAHRPEELGDIITGISVGTGGAVLNAAPSAGGWPPGIVPEMTPGCLHHSSAIGQHLSVLFYTFSQKHVANTFRDYLP